MIPLRSVLLQSTNMYSNEVDAGVDVVLLMMMMNDEWWMMDDDDGGDDDDD